MTMSYESHAGADAAVGTRWVPPSPEECWEEPAELIQVDPRNRIIVRRVEWNDQLVDYAITWWSMNPADEYEERVCIDCKHGTVHRHDGTPHSKAPRRVIRDINSQEDVQQSFNTSFDEVYDAYLASVEEL